MIPVITVDGPSGSGKGTICQLLSAKLGFHLLDSGALYRLTALAATNGNVSLDDAAAVANIAATLDISFSVGNDGVAAILSGEDVTRAIRQEKISMGASVVAAHTPVREALLARQREFKTLPGLVADGRDMGTVVFPDAPVKVFLTASAEERGQRRYNQLISRGESANLRALCDDIKARDERDMNRSVSPLVPASDAVEIDSTVMSIDQVLETVLELVDKYID